jgi:heptosyltransferase-2
MGDVILTTPLLRALRARHPDAVLVYLTRPAFAPLLADHPSGVEVLTFDPRQEALTSLARRLRARHFTHLLDLHGVTRTRLLRLLVPGSWRGYSKRRLARWMLVHTKRDVYGPPVPEAERYFEAALDLGVTPDGAPAQVGISSTAAASGAAWLAHKGFDGRRPIAALAPGAAHFTKRWPAEYWEMLTRSLVAQGYDVAVLTGSDLRAEGAAIAVAGGVNAATTDGVLGLQETAAVIRAAQVLASGDTGLMHLATAVGTRVVALFGPTVRQFGFFPYRSPATVLELALECRPCSAQGGAKCPLGHHRCLVGILPERVLAAVDSGSENGKSVRGEGETG